MMLFRRKKTAASGLLRADASAGKSIPSFWGKASTPSEAPAPDCAVWNDIARALDAKPRSAR
jgi:hypothetical protein